MSDPPEPKRRRDDVTGIMKFPTRPDPATPPVLGKRVSDSEAPASTKHAIEVKVVAGDAPTHGGERAAMELWTQNTVYVLDHQRRCIEVFEAQTWKPQPKHALLGARLVGGQRGLRTVRYVTLPLPLLGSVAVFQTGPGQPLAHTSAVERCVMVVRAHLRRSDAVDDEAWDELTGHFLEGK